MKINIIKEKLFKKCYECKKKNILKKTVKIKIKSKFVQLTR